MGYSRKACPDHSEVSEFFRHHFCERFKAGRFSDDLQRPFGYVASGGVQTLDRMLALKEKD